MTRAVTRRWSLSAGSARHGATVAHGVVRFVNSDRRLFPSYRLFDSLTSLTSLITQIHAAMTPTDESSPFNFQASTQQIVYCYVHSAILRQ